ncbi:MAG: phage holin family protein [Candidatus Nomurabacteria bacterium]|jgi:putative membrane protein|nr:phage holin family protein [Candidatus Nomurabacteria bacterium]
MAKQIYIFILRWVSCTVGLWIVVELFGKISTDSTSFMVATFLLAGLIFSVINAVLKPILTVLSLPFLIVTLGLFMLIVNGFLVWLTVALAPNLEMTFGAAIIGGLVLSLINYCISGILEASDTE